jgi:hypothetical protein
MKNKVRRFALKQVASAPAPKMFAGGQGARDATVADLVDCAH